MSISKRVTNAFKALNFDNDPEEALFQICPAIDATSKKENYKGANNVRYKTFLSDNVRIITKFSFGTEISGLSFGNPDGTLTTLEEIIYHQVRCSLTHEAKLPDDFSVTNNSFTGSGDIPRSVVQGLIMCVVLSPVNSQEKTNPGFYYYDIDKKQKFHLNDMWGKRDQLSSVLGYAVK